MATKRTESGYTRELAVLHCLSEAARLRSGVPV